MAMFTFFGHSSNLMVLHKLGNKQQLGGLRLSHAEAIIQPDAEQPTDDSQINYIFLYSPQASYQRFKSKIRIM